MRDSFQEQLHRSLGGSYRIERELGGGGMSRVFLAEELALSRRVVVKVLSPELAHDLSAERFAREIRLSARLQHPNIVPLLASGTSDALPYYTMPFIEGESLRARLARLAPGERLPLPQAIEALRDVARALNYAHGFGVVHRDIKPENVLLGNDAALVADFGVAKAVAAARSAAGPAGGITLTQGGASLGTPGYMSPEQAAGDPSVDHRADLYSWGVLAYEVLSGAHPFADRASVQALVTAHLVEQAIPLGEAAPFLPPELAALVMRCLAKAAAERPAGAGEILDVLGRAALAAGEPSPGRPVRAPAAARGARAWWPPRRRTLALTGLVAVLVAGTALVDTIRGRLAVARPPASPSLSRSPGYDAYLRGKVRVASENREDIEAATAALQEAVAADPDLAPAHAELARAYTIMAFYFADDSAKKRLTEEAEIAVEKALSLDPRCAEAYFARGLLLWTPGRRFPHEQAVQAFRQALALDSTLDEAHHQLAVVYFHLGLLDRGQEELERALAINSGNTLARFRLGVINMYRGRYDAAYAIFNSTPLERNPALWAFQTGTALFRLGREAEARALIDQFLKDYPRDEGGVGHSVRAMMAAKAGRRAEADAAIARAIELGRRFGHFHHTAYNIASAYALLGEAGPAIQWLQTAVDDGFPCYPLLAADNHLDALRADPRFVELMARLKSDYEARERTL